jgi:serine/threonine protein kinase
MNLTQSSVEFPVRYLRDWYTLTGTIIGSGGFAEVQEAWDDRALLFHMKNLQEGDESSSSYQLRNDPSSEMVTEHVNNIRDFVYYLSYFDMDSLSSLFKQMFPKLEILSDSRYELIIDMAKNWYTVLNPGAWISTNHVMTELFGDELVLRPTVVIKIMSIDIDPNHSQEKFLKVAKTEVFGLGMVSSETPLLLNPSLHFLQASSTERVVSAIKTTPEGCAFMEFKSGGETVKVPIITCLVDYFYTPGNVLTSDTYFLVLSKTNGPTLLDLIESIQSKELLAIPKPLPGMFIWYVTWVMAHALQKSHDKKIIHNDVKLENVMYDTPTGGITLIDYGLSCHVDIGNRKIGKTDKCDAFGGTPGYAAKEIFEGHRYPGSDIWALGIMLWELATGISYDIGSDVIQARDRILAGEKPNLRRILYDMPHKQEFEVLLELIFQPETFLRPDANEVIQFIYNVFAPDFAATDADMIGNYLYAEGNRALEKILAANTGLEFTARPGSMEYIFPHAEEQSEKSEEEEIPIFMPPSPKRESSEEDEEIPIFMTPSPKRQRRGND